MNNEIFLQTSFQLSKPQDSDYEAKIFIEAGRNAMKSAESEVDFGKEVEEAINQEKGIGSKLNNIALWHYKNGLQQLQKAISHFEQAKCLASSKNYQKYVELKLKKCFEKTSFLRMNKLQMMEA
jgi:hypothetical protein